MQEKQWFFADRVGWPAGPWDGEPDKAQCSKLAIQLQEFVK
jgi:hypothetical protein